MSNNPDHDAPAGNRDSQREDHGQQQHVDRSIPPLSAVTIAARAKVDAWRREFFDLTGAACKNEHGKLDVDKLRQWQAARGLAPTGTMRRATIEAARQGKVTAHSSTTAAGVAPAKASAGAGHQIASGPADAELLTAAGKLERRLSYVTQMAIEDHQRSYEYRKLSSVVADVSETAADVGEDLSDAYGWIRHALGGKQHGPRFVDKSVALPPVDMWKPAQVEWKAAEAALEKHDLTAALTHMRAAAELHRQCQRRVDEYQARVGGGAAHVLEGLQLIVAASGVIETILSGGAAVTAGAGLMGIAGASAGGAVGTAVVLGGARVGAERIEGMDDTKWRDVFVDAGSAGLTTFIGALLAGPFSRVFIGRFSSYLSKACTPQILRALGWTLQLGGPMPREYFVTLFEKRAAEFLGGMAMTPYVTAVSVAYSYMMNGKKLTLSQFVETVGRQMVEGGVFQLFIGFVARGRGRAMDEYTTLRGERECTAPELAAREHASAEGESTGKASKEGAQEREPRKDVMDGMGVTVGEKAETGLLLKLYRSERLPPRQKARAETAIQFFKNKGMNEDAIGKQLNGIDLTRDVKVTEIPKGTELTQYQIPGGRQGNYYTKGDVHPLRLGISPKGTHWETGELMNKQGSRWVAAEDLEMLESTTAPVRDMWSVKPGEGISVQTAGGAKQYFAPAKDAKLMPATPAGSP